MYAVAKKQGQNFIAFLVSFLQAIWAPFSAELSRTENKRGFARASSQLKLLHAGQRGAFNIGFVIGVVVLIMIVAAAIPEAISSINGADTSGWSTGETALWGIIGLVVIAAVVFGILKMSGILGGRN